MTNQDRYASIIFLNAVLPLLKVIIESEDKLKRKFSTLSGIVQISAMNDNEKVATHYLIDEGEIKVVKGVHQSPTLELCFNSVESFNGFFKGTSKKLPKFKGLKHIKLFLATLTALLRMAKLLGLNVPPNDEEEKKLLVRLYFYLLSSGISQLNKAGHPEISKWVKKSPDRVYAWTVSDDESLSAFIRLKAGNSKASRGIYKRAKPFFTMRFDSPESALGILMETDDMIESTIQGKLVMEGAPEYGAQLGNYMTIVGGYAK